MFGKRSGSNSDVTPSGPYYRPYKNEAANHLYNLLFCDNPTLFRNDAGPKSPLSVVLSNSADRETLEKIGNDLDAESRVRVLAFNRLRAMKVSVPSKRLLGAIIEVPQKDGFDVLAAFPDGRLRYINQSEKLSIFEDTPPKLVEKANELLRASQIIVNRIGPWDQPRLPPPKGEHMRMSFLVSDGLYFGEGRFAALMQDRMAAPVINASTELLLMVVDAALEKDRSFGKRR